MKKKITNRKCRNIIWMIASMIMLMGILTGCKSASKFDFLSGDKDFMNCNLGDAEQTVIKNETRSVLEKHELEEQSLLSYKGITEGDLTMDLIYVIENGVFCEGIIYFRGDDLDALYNELYVYVSDMCGTEPFLNMDGDVLWNKDQYVIGITHRNTKLTYSIETKDYFMGETK